MKKALLAVAFSGMVLVGFCQQDPQFSQNMRNRLFPNPGVAGSNDAICATLLGRNQWVGFEGAPESYLFSVHAPLNWRLPGTNWQVKSGVGLSIVTDRLGQESTFGVKLSYAHRQPLNLGGIPAHLGIGIGVGMISKSIGQNWRATDAFFSDAAIPDNGAGNNGFDADFGLYYKTDDNKLYIGLSVTHLSESDIAEAGDGLSAQLPTNPDVVPYDFNYQVARHYYVMAGYNYPLNPAIVLKPSVFMKSDALSTQIDVNMSVEYNNKFWGGVTYRAVDAIVPMVGVNHSFNTIPGTFKFGYSYDVTTSLIRTASSGTHEILLNYCFKLNIVRPIEKHKTVRFL